MNIAFVMARMGNGGAERVVSELANHFSELGYNTEIIVMVDSNSAYKLSDSVKLIDLSRRCNGMVGRIRCLHKHLKTSDYDIVISFLTTTNIESILAVIGTGKKIIISERNNPYIDPPDKIYRLMRKLFYWLANGFVFQTPDAQRFFSKSIQKRSRVIMNPINPQLPKFYDGARSNRIVSVGRLFEQKNHFMFIDAFGEFYKKHNDYIAEIYGEGPLEDKLKEYIYSKNLTGKVILKGSSRTVLEDINDAACFVMSSNYEGMSNALIEAVGMGIPTISTDHPIGGARMIIEDKKNGFLVPVGDSKTLAEKMDYLINDLSVANEISFNGTKLRERLSIEKITQQWIEYISVVMRN